MGELPNPEVVDPVDAVEVDTEEVVEEPKLFTQAELDAKINKRFARERARHEQEMEELRATINKSESEVVSAKFEQAQSTIATLTSQLNEVTVRSAAIEAAYALDVKPEKIDSILRLADLPSVDEDGVNARAVKSAIAAVLKENPEWIRPKGTGVPVGAGDLGQQVPTEAEPKSISDAVLKYFS